MGYIQCIRNLVRKEKKMHKLKRIILFILVLSITMSIVISPVNVAAVAVTLNADKNINFENENTNNISTNTVAKGELVSVTYKMDDKNDGYANGTVTIEADSADINGADCVMYWADSFGKPLEGYTALAKFRLTGEVTVHEMYDYTIIPEGAKSLIAYKSVAGELSGKPVMTNLPKGCNYILEDNHNIEFQLISDIHIRAEDNHVHNIHFNQMLADVRKNSPDSIGIFVNGDITDNGQRVQYEKLVSMYNTANSDGDLPNVHISIGNHDWYAGNIGNRFQQYVKKLNGSLLQQPRKVYYHEEVAGYNFIFLGGENSGHEANLSKTQLKWFDDLMKDLTQKDPEKPVFVLLHQPLKDTVAGTLPGHGWHGVKDEQNLRDVLKKYDQIIIAGGHSHWELNSEANMYPGDDNMSVAVNTASVAYLWSSYNIASGEHADGSNGYFVRVYDDKVVFLGRDFENQRYISSAMFVVEKNHIETSKDTYYINVNTGKTELKAEFADEENIKFESSDNGIVEVSSSGSLTPVSVGTAEIMITAYATGKYVKNYKTVKVVVTDHNHIGAVTTEPTCTEEGVMTYTCKKDTKHVYTEVIPALGHAWTKEYVVDIPATTKSAGSKSIQCTVCNEMDDATIIEIPAVKTVKLSSMAYTYDGKVKSPLVKIMDDTGKALVKGTDYDIKYGTGRKNVGTYKVTVTFKGDYDGSVVKTFKINPKATKFNKMTAGKKQIAVKWIKSTAQVTGYEIRYSTKPSMADAKTKLVKKANITSLRLTGLKAKTKYYVQIRTLKTVKGVKYYSDWSKAKTVTTK